MFMKERRPSSGCGPPYALPDLYAPVQEELDQVEHLLGEELRSDHPFVDGLVQYGFRLGGKRLRPALVLLSAQACGSLRPRAHRRWRRPWR